MLSVFMSDFFFFAISNRDFCFNDPTTIRNNVCLSQILDLYILITEKLNSNFQCLNLIPFVRDFHMASRSPGNN
jgi:hypothetical protein